MRLTADYTLSSTRIKFNDHGFFLYGQAASLLTELH